MAKVSINQVVAKAERQERAGNFKKAADAYGAILKSGIASTAARNGYLRSVNRFTKPPLDKLAFQKQATEIATLIENGAWAAAENLSARLIKTFPNNVLLLNMNGVAQLGLGNAKKAAAVLNLALALRPDYADAHQNLGLALQQVGKPEAALESFKAAVHFNPKFAKAWDNIGTMHQFFGDSGAAIDAHMKAIALQPDLLEARRNLYVVFKNIRFYPQAAEQVRAILEAGETSATNYRNLGALTRKMEDPNGALAALEKSLEIDPKFSEALIDKGHCLRMLGKKKEAAAAYREALRQSPKSISAYFALTSVVKFSSDDLEFVQMEELADDPRLSLNHQSLIEFSLAYAYEHVSDLEKSFIHLKKGNAARKNDLGYDIESDRKMFSDIKGNSEKIALTPVNFETVDDAFSPIFILGMPRSGTTLTEQIVSAHPDVFGAGELTFGSHFGQKIAKGEIETTPQVIEEFRNSYLSAVQTLSPDKPYVTDKMPHNFRYIGLLSKAFPNCKIVRMQRDPGAVCWSNFHVRFSANGLGYSNDLNDIVAHYHLYEDMIAHWREALPNSFYDLDYDYLTKHQEDETRRLIAFLELDWHDACLSPERNERKVLTASYSQVTKKVYKGSSQKWKRYEPFLDGAFESLYS